MKRHRDVTRTESGKAQGAIVDVGVLEDQIEEQRIARRAYAIYESRGRADGHADDDWFQAESESRSATPRARD